MVCSAMEQVESLPNKNVIDDMEVQKKIVTSMNNSLTIAWYKSPTNVHCLPFNSGYI